MSSTPPAAGYDVPGLLERLTRADCLADAAALLFDAVLDAEEGRAALLAERAGELCGLEGRGWAPERLAALRVELSAASPIAEAFRTGDRVVVPGSAAIQGAGDLPPTLVQPLPCAAPGSDAFGVLLLEVGGWSDERVEHTAQAVLRVAPAIGRFCELEELRRNAQRLDQQRELLTAIVNALPDPVLVTDADNGVLLENRRAETLLTTAEVDSEGRRRAVEINNLLLSSFLTRAVTPGRDGGARELNLVDPLEGGDLLFEVITTPLPSTLASGAATVSVLRDVTDLKRATAELERQFKRVRQAELKARRERDRLNLILETVGDPILVTDAQANIILMNREAERLFEGPPNGELDPRGRQDVRANDTKFSSSISDLALSADVTRVSELQLADPESGRGFPAEVVSGKVFNERSEMTAIVSIVHDLTKAVENERLAEELAHLNEGLEDRVRSATTELEERNRQLTWQRQELERAYRLKSEFLASMSHELRTPINALLGYTSLMRERIYGDLTVRQEEALQRMYAASQHLLELVNDVLDLAKIEAGKMPVHIQSLDLGLLVREISLTIEPIVRRKSLEYHVEVDPELPRLTTDGTKVKQVLLNLLSNAAKFTHEGRITLVVRRVEGPEGVEIAVSDTGIGIRSEDVETIFDDFRQVDQSSTREYGGTGLGLSITKKLLSLLGGTIRVESSPGQGSTFTVWLPLRGREISTDAHIARAAMSADSAVVDHVDADDATR